jgi:hypothetical protein
VLIQGLEQVRELAPGLALEQALVLALGRIHCIVHLPASHNSCQLSSSSDQLDKIEAAIGYRRTGSIGCK